MEIRIAGFGGQGIVLSGSIIGKAASIFNKGFAALTQSYGPESRGGSCRAEVVVSDNPIGYPYAVSPNVQIILSQEAYTEYGRNALQGSLVIVDSDLVIVDPNSSTQPLPIPASRMAQDMGRAVVANIIMLGFLAAKSDIVPYEALKNAVLDSVPAGTEDFNNKAFDLGYSYGIDQSRGT
ncbi:2-oxoacid:acceptor oxidoreductase family protein [Chloroflexota bacterium]